MGLERLSGRKPRTSGSGMFYDDFTAVSREGTPGLSNKVYKRLRERFFILVGECEEPIQTKFTTSFILSLV